MNNEKYYNESNEEDCNKNNEWYYNKNNEGCYDKNNEEYYNKNNEGNNKEYNYYDIELEYIDTDLKLVERNISLEIEHIEVESNSYLARTDSSNLSKVLQLSTIQHKKRAKKSKDSLVKPFYEDLNSQASVLSKNQLKEILINAKDRVMQSMREHAYNDKKICYISFTTDIWTSDNDDFKISYLLYPHTAEQLANKIIEILNKFQLISKVVYCTADNGVNIKSCLRKLEDRYNIFKNFCFGHTLNLVVNDVLKRCLKIINIIKKYKDIVSHFSGSPKQKQFLLIA
ncbi:9604_t:CDS:2 [Scutellospora calospora]|uniref:9604_t:CDS:1 n=1 Tax=Scutellospora calospora TaxID=85575 RepID=A0ACA9K1T7_9GLOM|nr:9604_t:CDS:2 [Scutellospora calospora]